MRKMLKKIMPVVALSALIILIGGFCDGLIASAQTGDNLSKMDQMMDTTLTVPAFQQVMDQSGLPIDNSLMPCCVGSHSVTPTTQVANFNAGVRFAAIDSALADSNLDAYFAQKITSLSDPSPPAPDILSSVLRRE